MPTYGKKTSNVCSVTNLPITLYIAIKRWGCNPYQVCKIDDPRLTFIYFVVSSNLIPNASI